MNHPEQPNRPSLPSALVQATDLLDHAIKKVPAARYFWGVVAASATVAIISFLNGLNRVTFVAIFAALIAMFIFYVFSRLEKASDPVVRLVGRILILATGLAFVFVIATTAWLGLTCKPPLMAYLYGVSEFCERTKPSLVENIEKPTVATFRNIVRKNGAFIGVNPVSADQAKHLSLFYELTSVGSSPPRTVEVRPKNGSGECALDGLTSITGDEFGGACSAARACLAKYSYRQDGTVDSEKILDQVGNRLEELQYHPTASVGQFVDAVFPCNHGRAGIRLLQFERVTSGPNAGLDETIRFLDRDNHSSPNDKGNFGRQTVYDNGHRPTMITNLGPQGQNWSVKGVATVRTVYNDKGLAELEEYLSIDGAATLDGEGIGQKKMSYDPWGNAIEMRLFGVNGDPSTRAFTSFQSKFDDRGNMIERTYFDSKGHPTLSKENGAKVASKFDEKGNEVERKFYDIAGKLMHVAGDEAGWRAKYDERGAKIEIEFFGVDERPMLLKGGYSSKLVKYDSRLNVTEEKYLSVDRSVGFPAELWPVAQFSYSQANKKLSAEGFNRNGQPVLDKEGVASWRAKFDDRGNQTEIVNYGVNGKPILIKNGYWGSRRKFDQSGSEVETAYFGFENRPILCKEGYALTRSKYDDRQNLIELSFFDADGKPVLASYGYAGWRAEYDERNNMTQFIVLGRDGQPMLKEDTGTAGFRAKFDESRNNIEARFLGIDLKPNVNNKGIAGWKAKYEGNGDEVERIFFGADLKPILNNEGYAGWQAEYDNRRNQIVSRYVGLKSELVVSKNDDSGWLQTYDARNNVVETIYLGADSKPVLNKEGVAGWRAKYDEKNRQIESINLGVDSKPVLNNEGFAGWRAKYDERNGEVERTFLGVELKAGLTKEGIAGWENRYNAQGQRVEETFVDAEGKLVALNGRAVILTEYDAFGREVEVRFLGVDRKLSNSSLSGRSVTKTEYNIYSQNILESSFDEFEQPVDRSDEGWSTKQWLYNANGQLEKIILCNKVGHEVKSQ